MCLFRMTAIALTVGCGLVLASASFACGEWVPTESPEPGQGEASPGDSTDDIVNWTITAPSTHMKVTVVGVVVNQEAEMYNETESATRSIARGFKWDSDAEAKDNPETTFEANWTGSTTGSVANARTGSADSLQHDSYVEVIGDTRITGTAGWEQEANTTYRSYSSRAASLPKTADRDNALGASVNHTVAANPIQIADGFASALTGELDIVFKRLSGGLDRNDNGEEGSANSGLQAGGAKRTVAENTVDHGSGVSIGSTVQAEVKIAGSGSDPIWNNDDWWAKGTITASHTLNVSK